MADKLVKKTLNFYDIAYMGVFDVADYEPDVKIIKNIFTANFAYL